MNKPDKSFSVAECKIQASKLLKVLHSTDITQANQVAKRMQRLPEFTKLSLDKLQTAVKRKHALALIAIEKGFNSWAELKIQLPFIRGGFLNHWFSSYAEAKQYLQKNGGYLLPFKNQFFICDATYIENLGFNPNDSDWKLIGYDWAKPVDKNAWQRLYKEWVKIQGGSDE